MANRKIAYTLGRGWAYIFDTNYGTMGRFWKSGNLEIWGPGNPEFLRSGDLEIQKFGVQKIKKIKIIKIQIRSAQNVGKVWICRKKSSWPYLGQSDAIFSIGRKHQKLSKICLFSLVGQWALFTRTVGTEQPDVSPTREHF